MQTKKIILGIIFIALFLRVFLLDNIPYGFYADEASSAYDAYSLLLTGKDRYGENFPVLFRAFDDYIPPVLNYTELISIFLFGLNILAVRLVPAVIGILTVVISFFLVKRLFNEHVALIAALFLAISPWHLQYSRIVFPAITFSLFFLLGAWLFFLGLEKKKFLVLSAVPFALAFYSYAISKLFVPLFLVGLFLTYRKDILKHKKHIVYFLVLLIVLSLPAIYTSLYSEGQKRFSNLSIFREEKESILTDNKNIERHYKTFFNNYFSYFSLDFLFLEGDKNIRHSIRNIGQLYLFDLPFVLIGLALCLWKRQNNHKLLLWWLIIYPIAASLTIAEQHATRTITAILLFQILSAYGLYTSYCFVKERLSKYLRLFLAAVVLIILVNFFYYSYNYFIEYPKYSRDAFEAEIGNTLAYAESVKSNYDEIDLTYAMDQPYIYVLFYNQLNPLEYQQYGLNKTKYKIGYMGFLYNESKNALYIAKSFELKDKKEQKVFYYNDGQVAFRII